MPRNQSGRSARRNARNARKGDNSLNGFIEENETSDSSESWGSVSSDENSSSIYENSDYSCSNSPLPRETRVSRERMNSKSKTKNKKTNRKVRSTRSKGRQVCLRCVNFASFCIN